MVRTSQRLSSTSTTSNRHKRVISSGAETAKVLKKPRQAKLGQPSQPEEDDDDQLTSATDQDEDASAFGDETNGSSSESSEDEDEYNSDDDQPKPRRKPTPKKSTPRASTTNGPEVWREGVSAGLGPGKQVVIKKPKARSAGKVPYKDDTLHPNTFLFLADLKANNERQWLKMNDPDFRQAEKDWFSFVEKLTERLSEIDETVPELPVKDVIFRIYRDVRFSPDPTPYKAHFSAAFSRTGRKGPYAAYYVQIGPEGGLIAGGIWHPEAAPLAALRRAVDTNPRVLKDLLLQDGIRKEFLNNSAKNHAKVCKAFVASNAEGALKTKPKGFDSDHADIELLRLRNYTISRRLSQAELLDNGLERLAELLTCLQPFITYLNSIVMPDPDEDDADSNDGDDADDQSSEAEE